MLDRKAVDRIIPILKKDIKRSLKMKVRGFPKPYYSSFLLRDIEWFNTWASSGSVYRKKSDRSRNVYCDIRVGSYRYDQVTSGGLNDNDEETESYSHISVPIDDKDYDGLLLGLWRLSESKFREALTDYSNRESAALSTVDLNKKYSSFKKLPAIKDIKYSRTDYVDEEYWVKFCKRASKWLSNLKGVASNWVEVDVSQETKIFVSTENRVIVQHFKVYSLIAGIRHLTKDGHNLEQELVLNFGKVSEMPKLSVFKKQMLKKHQQLLKLVKAKKISSFKGPALLAPLAAGLLFHEALGHRLEGNRLLDTSEGRTFYNYLGKEITPISLTFEDLPNLKKFQGQTCIGSYSYDDEGTEAKNAKLIDDGKVLNYLNTRAQLPIPDKSLNGHARNRKFERPISRMGVSKVSAKDGKTFKELKALLLEEIKKQKLPFGIIIYNSSNGETETSTFDFQAFSGEISYAVLVTPRGKEIPVKGVDFVGTPLAAISNILAVGSELEMENHYCGAESGMIPVTTIAPAVLLSSLELQAKPEELVTQYLLPRPRLS